MKKEKNNETLLKVKDFIKENKGISIAISLVSIFFILTFVVYIKNTFKISNKLDDYTFFINLFAPFITFISVVFLYLTFKEQRNQYVKNYQKEDIKELYSDLLCISNKMGEVDAMLYYFKENSGIDLAFLERENIIELDKLKKLSVTDQKQILDTIQYDEINKKITNIKFLCNSIIENEFNYKMIHSFLAITKTTLFIIQYVINNERDGIVSVYFDNVPNTFCFPVIDILGGKILDEINNIYSLKIRKIKDIDKDGINKIVKYALDNPI